ncbi:MAG: histidine phosphatase family protein, partial [Oscillospiraceae bacterium]|nr:histidine phosphatase family protein [Oscillospiraceae bacterium]
MKLYYTRHGETEWNVLDNICGRTDIPLTAKGIEQAEELARNIAEMGLYFDLILVSLLQRAQQTAARVAAVT